VPPTAPPTQAATPPTAPFDLPLDFWKRLDGSTATIPLSEATIQAFYPTTFASMLPFNHTTTPYAYERLFNAEVDLILVTYPSEQEQAQAEEMGFEMELIPIVRDALVMLVNVDNPITDLSSEQLRGIYGGEITNWSEVGGNDEEILAFQRSENSGSQTLFLKLLMEGIEPMKPISEWIMAGMAGLVDAVSSYDNGPASIGYNMFYYVEEMYGNDQFRLLAVDGVVPDRGTISRGEYPLGTYYYAVLDADTPKGAQARELIDWMLSEAAQIIYRAAGYVPLWELQ